MPNSDFIKIRSDERVFIAGKTGSGKTVLARQMLARTTRLIVIDPKARLDNWDTEDYDAVSRDAIRRGERIRVRVLLPIEEDIQPFVDEVIKLAYSAGNIVVYIDEVYGIIDPGDKPTKWLTALYTRGREQEVGVVAVSQRPAWVPLFMMSEADHFFSFRLNIPEDRKRMMEVTGMTEVVKPIYDIHGFYYYHNGAREAQYVERLHLRNERKEVADGSNQARRLPAAV